MNLKRDETASTTQKNVDLKNLLLISSILTYTKYLNFRCALPSDVFTGEEKKSMAYFFNITYKKDSENSCY